MVAKNPTMRLRFFGDEGIGEPWFCGLQGNKKMHPSLARGISERVVRGICKPAAMPPAGPFVGRSATSGHFSSLFRVKVLRNQGIMEPP